ncbi:MAG TPA: hypothetical protein DEA22_10620 [Blastocatellia bacterium]|nr:hypothetical protein [Blastocatellia bacterium]
MPATELQKRSIVFVIFTVAIAAVLDIFPFVETAVESYLLFQFGYSVLPDGSVLTETGVAPNKLTENLISLLINVFHIVKIILWMMLVIGIVRFFTFLLFQTALRKSEQTEIASLLKTVLSIIIYIVAFFVIFQSQYPGVQLAPLLTGSTIIGIVVGLALQDTLGNLFAGIAMQADQPFQVGDVISISNRGMGVVEEVSWRGVKIRTYQNKLLVISNSVLGNETIEVAPRNNLNGRLVTFNTLYSDSPAKTARVVLEAVRNVEYVSQKKRPLVRIRNFGDSGLDWEVKYWTERYDRINETDASIRQRIWYAFQRENIGFAFPTRTLYLEKKRAESSPEDRAASAAEVLSQVSLFEPLTQGEIATLAGGSNIRLYAPGEMIVRRGQEGRSMFVVVRGAVEIQIPTAKRNAAKIQIGVNDFFGEMSLLTGEPRSATVVAIEETEVLQIRKETLKPLFEANPDLMRCIGEIIAERRAFLKAEENFEESMQPDREKGVLRSIRRFFGMN